MDMNQIKFLKKQFDFDKWSGMSRLEKDFTVRNIVFSVDLISGLKLERVREIDPGDKTRLLRMSWTATGKTKGLLMIDVRECDTREAAHKVLLELLGNMQAPDVRMLDRCSFGDVSFGRKKSTAVIFARANIAVSIKNGGEAVLSVTKAAQAIDRAIMEQANTLMT